MKLALCNEVLRHLPFEEQCRLAAAIGCQGLEVAPFTLAEEPEQLNGAEARLVRELAADHGITIASLHWLLVQPAGLSIATPDATVRRRTLDFLRRLIGFAADCGAGVLVHGSPAQRAPMPGQSVADALARCEDAWAELAADAARAGVTYCIEPLAPEETPVLNTLAQAARIVDRIGSPALRTMMDLSAASRAESEPPAEVLARFLASGHVAHVQLNDRNRRGPGQGDTPVAPVLRVLHAAGYRGWVALEPFVYEPDPLACAAASAAYVRGIREAIA